MDRSLFFDGCPDPLAVVVGDVIQEQNPAWGEAIGPAPSLLACFAPEDHAAVRSAFAEAASGPVRFESRLAVGPHGGASMRCTLWSAGGETRCLRLEGPMPAAAAAAPADIVRSKEKALLWLFGEMDATLWAILRDGTVCLSEGHALARYGMRPGQLVGLNVLQDYPPETQTVRTTQIVLGGQPLRDVYVEDEQYWAQHSYPIRGEDGEVFAMVGLAMAMTDGLTELRHAQQLLKIVNELPFVVWAMRSDGICTLSAGKGLSQLGLAPGALVGRNLLELYANVPPSLQAFRRALAGESFTDEDEQEDGSLWRTTYYASMDATGQVTGMFAVSEDITERARDERRMREQLALIQAQKQAIDQLVSPVLEVWRGVLVVPLIGEIGAERAAVVTERLLGDVVRHAASFAILDLTGIDTVDTHAAQHLFNIMRGVELLGCKALISGIRPSVASTMVSLGLEIPTGRTFSTLAEALRRCMRSVEVRGQSR
ncbi:STAS domain-containing protein [Polyangium aurulentum]|uniref:STAS domain-containing protein n=1 Tax=Polyangium aurulentum TaxID=2567896 RepID=UPI00146C5785|nr:STAS domain-containing protein [Polyangium aurulentum]UQA54959.1 STAS domain-containing protein [Polyangium aurulentum]